jgi:acyl-CoA synthetase (NDP forming)
MHPLEKMFRPRSVAVVGASGDPEKLGGRTLLHLKQLGYQGRIYPINVSATEVQGLPAWPSVADLPETPDCALILLPAKLVAKAIDDCAAKGVKHVQVLSSGFAEEGGEGVAMQDALAKQARAYGMRLTGPNCPRQHLPARRLLRYLLKPAGNGEAAARLRRRRNAVGCLRLPYLCRRGIPRHRHQPRHRHGQ